MTDVLLEEQEENIDQLDSIGENTDDSTEYFESYSEEYDDIEEDNCDEIETEETIMRAIYQQMNLMIQF